MTFDEWFDSRLKGLGWGREQFGVDEIGNLKHAYEAGQASRPEAAQREPTIGELKDMYTIAQHVGIPGSRIDAFVKTAAMAGYIFVRATVASPTPQHGSEKNAG